MRCDEDLDTPRRFRCRRPEDREKANQSTQHRASAYSDNIHTQYRCGPAHKKGTDIDTLSFSWVQRTDVTVDRPDHHRNGAAGSAQDNSLEGEC
jgi:hypothetical protein